jgi:N6-adenosine-specific RNA methylase IME4
MSVDSVRYATIVADPPWPYSRGLPRWTGKGVDNSDNLPYPTLDIDQISSLPVASLYDDYCHLYLWTTSRFLEDSFEVVRSWGFQFSQVLTWCKPARGFVGRATFSPVSEFILFAHTGRVAAKKSVSQSWFAWPRGEHSRKPDAFYDLVESVSRGPYLELFARRQRLGWDTWGNEALEHVEVMA